jgi:hypothetical protein
MKFYSYINLDSFRSSFFHQVLFFLLIKRLTVKVAPPERKRIELIGSGACGSILSGGSPNGRSPNGGSPNGGSPNGGSPNGGSLNGGPANGGVSGKKVRNGGVSNGGVLTGGASNGGELKYGCAYEKLGNVNANVKTINVIVKIIFFINPPLYDSLN